MLGTNKENYMPKMPVAAIFLCILQVATLVDSSPLPHGSRSMKNEQQTDVSTGLFQRETPYLIVPLASVPLWFPRSFLLPYNLNHNISLSPRQQFEPLARNKLWRTLRGSQTVVCYGDDGRPFDGFPCEDNVCVPLHWVCDGDADCKGGDDEAQCVSCGRDELYCRMRGVTTCLSPELLCDGRRDCLDGSDEDPDRCHSSCEFRCHEGGDCVAYSLVCDEDHDCIDGSDEIDCDHHSPHNDCDPKFEFQCYNSLDEDEWPHCVPRAWLCDNHDDCPHGEDEYVDSCSRK
ncbi:low-density lipoprotein receptor-like isoform X2 [Zootermopsis nevadensis]|nr:low-density lipoprotein receptor-like isoform X2 [Zootermopsis nevadensis]